MKIPETPKTPLLAADPESRVQETSILCIGALSNQVLSSRATLSVQVPGQNPRRSS